MRNRGFTIVELLIVIVVIAILAAVSLVAYNGIQSNARDSQRKSDIQAIVKALEMYHTDNGNYPLGSGSTTINNSWSTTADASWDNLEAVLRPYASRLPRDPTSTLNENVQSSGYNYAYRSGTFCDAADRQTFIIVYRFQVKAQQNDLNGSCTGTALGPFGGSNTSNYRTVKR